MTRNTRNPRPSRNPQVVYIREEPKKKSSKGIIYLIMLGLAAAVLLAAYANRKAIWMGFAPILNAMGSFALMVGVFGFLGGVFAGSSKFQAKSGMVIILGAALVGIAQSQWL